MIRLLMAASCSLAIVSAASAEYRLVVKPDESVVALVDAPSGEVIDPEYIDIGLISSDSHLIEAVVYDNTVFISDRQQNRVWWFDMFDESVIDCYGESPCVVSFSLSEPLGIEVYGAELPGGGTERRLIITQANGDVTQFANGVATDVLSGGAFYHDVAKVGDELWLVANDNGSGIPVIDRYDLDFNPIESVEVLGGPGNECGQIAPFGDDGGFVTTREGIQRESADGETSYFTLYLDSDPGGASGLVCSGDYLFSNGMTLYTSSDGYDASGILDDTSPLGYISNAFIVAANTRWIAQTGSFFDCANWSGGSVPLGGTVDAQILNGGVCIADGEASGESQLITDKFEVGEYSVYCRDDDDSGLTEVAGWLRLENLHTVAADDLEIGGGAVECGSLTGIGGVLIDEVTEVTLDDMEFAEVSMTGDPLFASSAALVEIRNVGTLSADRVCVSEFDVDGLAVSFASADVDALFESIESMDVFRMDVSTVRGSDAGDLYASTNAELSFRDIQSFEIDDDSTIGEYSISSCPYYLYNSAIVTANVEFVSIDALDFIDELHVAEIGLTNGCPDDLDMDITVTIEDCQTEIGHELYALDFSMNDGDVVDARFDFALTDSALSINAIYIGDGWSDGSNPGSSVFANTVLTRSRIGTGQIALARNHGTNSYDGIYDIRMTLDEGSHVAASLLAANPDATLVFHIDGTTRAREWAYGEPGMYAAMDFSGTAGFAGATIEVIFDIEVMPGDRFDLIEAANFNFEDFPSFVATGLPSGTMIQPIIDTKSDPQKISVEVIALNCDADLNGDDVVDFLDILAVVAGWGTPDGDVTGDGTTDFDDLLEVITNFGVCGAP